MLKKPLNTVKDNVQKAPFSQLEKVTVWRAYDGLCYWCNEPVELRQVTVDHVFPEKLLDTRNEHGYPAGAERQDGRPGRALLVHGQGGVRPRSHDQTGPPVFAAPDGQAHLLQRRKGPAGDRGRVKYWPDHNDHLHIEIWERP